MPKTVLITGCSSGFGAAAANLFAERGWNVIATMRNPQAGAGLARHDNVFVTRLDVEDHDSIEAACTEGIARFGRVDVLVNNAGVGLYGVFESFSREKVLEQFAVNTFGVMDVIRAMLPHFRANRSGVIVNVTSGAGAFAVPTGSIYSASKFAVEGFSEGLYYELAGLGIVVKIVEPGAATSTGFLSRSDMETAQLQAPPDYADFLAATEVVFEGFKGGVDENAVEKVAAAIFGAATDGTDQLRYVPTDDIQPIIAARREQSEQGFMGLMRTLFAPVLGMRAK